MPPAPDHPSTVHADVAVVGAGVAGLWIARRAQAAGLRVQVVEQAAIGGIQTLASQGMVHGGIKYALGGLTHAADAIAGMPARWRDCLAGTGEIDLRAVTVLSPDYHLYSTGALASNLAALLASRALRGRVERLARSAWPAAFRHGGFDGSVFRLHDPVLDTAALAGVLAGPLAIAHGRLAPAGLEWAGDQLVAATLAAPAGATAGTPGTAAPLRIIAARWVFAAGAGNGDLLAALPRPPVAMQLRPLHQVIVRHPALPVLHAHCVTGIQRPEPRLTITTHPGPDGAAWYLGGQIATAGVARDPAAQVAFARAELAACVGWLDLRDATISTLRIDRAEPAQAGGQRPDEAFAVRAGNVVVAWPTKLALAPDLGDRAIALLADIARDAQGRSGPAPGAVDAVPGAPSPSLPRPPRPPAGTQPWQTVQTRPA